MYFLFTKVELSKLKIYFYVLFILYYIISNMKYIYLREININLKELGIQVRNMIKTTEIFSKTEIHIILLLFPILQSLQLVM